MNGILYGVGVGTGDPEMMTLKAVRIIRSADVICLPKIPKEECRAYRIALQAIPEIAEKEVLSFDFEMTCDKNVLKAKHQEIYHAVKEQLQKGKTLAFLTIGDPTVYSTFCYLAKLAGTDGLPVRFISGVTAFLASAAGCGISLCEGNEDLHIFSGQKGIGDIGEKLLLPGTKVILKCGRRADEIKDRLRKLEQENNVEIYTVQECGADMEQIIHGADSIPTDGKYMTTIIVKETVI